MQNKISVFFLITSFLILSVSCIGVSQTPDAVYKAFMAKYPDEKSPSWTIDAHGYHEAQFKKDGEKYRADFSEDGQWIETENTIKFKSLPEPVQSAIKKNYDKDDISEIEHVQSAAKGEFYDVEFKQKGKNLDVEYRANGEKIN